MHMRNGQCGRIVLKKLDGGLSSVLLCCRVGKKRNKSIQQCRISSARVLGVHKEEDTDTCDGEEGLFSEYLHNSKICVLDESQGCSSIDSRR